MNFLNLRATVELSKVSLWPGVRREYINYKISTVYIFFMPFGEVNEGNLFSVVINGDAWIQRLAEGLDWICVNTTFMG